MKSILKVIKEYLPKAIWEIFLIVTGIVLALMIDKLKDKYDNRQKANTILAQIRTDLEIDIETASEKLFYHMKKDSLLRKVMKGEYKPKDYIEKELRSLIREYESFNPNKANYDNLIREAKDLPIDYNELLADLTDLYTVKASLISHANNDMQELVNDYYKWLRQNTTWFSEVYFDGKNKNVSEERINFYMNNPHYKNFVYEYFNINIENQYLKILDFRITAEKCYQNIMKKLMNEGQIHKKKPSFQYDYKNYTHYEGKYCGGIGLLRIYHKHNKLFFELDVNGKPHCIIPIDKTRFIVGTGGFVYLNFNIKNELNYGVGNQTYSFKKVN